MLLYIHIPFCDSKCHYCSFNSYVDLFHLRETYMNALLIQLRFELERFNAQEKSIETIFIGGGTPSTVRPELYRPIFELLRPYIKDNAEITSEANPNSATSEWLEGMYLLGVNRISFGVQSFDDEKLKKLGRAHKASDASAALKRAERAGFEHLSLDLIYAVDGDTKELLEHDLKEAFALPIDHLSAYALTIEEGTPFASTPDVANEKLEDVMKELGMTEGFDVGLEMSGVPVAFNSMLNNMNHGGKIAMLGIPPSDMAVDWNQVIFKGLVIKGIYGREMFETWYKMASLIQSGLDISPIITHEFKIDDFQEGFDTMLSGQSGKVILDWA